MKIRTDSVFANLSEEDQQIILELASSSTIPQVTEFLNKRGFKCTPNQTKKFLIRLEQIELASNHGVDDLLIQNIDGGGRGLREAALATARSRMLRAAAKGDPDQYPRVFKLFSDEKFKEQKLALEARRVRALEESARLGWKKLELERAIAAARLLPKVWSIITDTTLDEKERVARAQRCLAKQASAFIEPPACPTKEQPANVSDPGPLLDP